MTPSMEAYLALHKRLLELRQSRPTSEEPEDLLLEEMDSAWRTLTPEEITAVERILSQLSQAASPPQPGPRAL